MFICYREDETIEVLNENNEKILQNFNNVQAIELDNIGSYFPYEKSVLRYEENGKYGIIDFEGQVITKAIFDEIASVKYKEGEILAKRDGKYGVINNKGVELIPFEYDEIEGDKYTQNDEYEKSGYIVKVKTENGYRCGYIDCKWKKVLEPEYTTLSRILNIKSRDAYLIASKNGKYGLIQNENEKIGFEYQSIAYNMDTNLVKVQRNENYGVLNLSGETILPIQYKSIKFNGIYICARDYENDKYFDKKGKIVETNFTSMKEINEQKCYITTNQESLYGIVDKDGNTLIDNEYLYIDFAFDKYFIAYKSGEGLGIIDKENNSYVEFKYDAVSRISDKKVIKAENSKENQITLFDKDMKEIITMKDAYISVHDDYVEIYNNENQIFIDNDGNVKTAEELEQVLNYLGDYYLTYKQNNEMYYTN